MSRYQFLPMSAADLPLVRGWLAAPHVTQWWGDPDEQFGLVSEDLDQPAMNQFVVTIDGRPFAYLQCYDQTAWPDNGLGIHPSGTRGIDQFIGEPDMTGRGHGSSFIRAFIVALIRAGTPRVSWPKIRRARRQAAISPACIWPNTEQQRMSRCSANCSTTPTTTFASRGRSHC